MYQEGTRVAGVGGVLVVDPQMALVVVVAIKRVVTDTALVYPVTYQTQ